LIQLDYTLEYQRLSLSHALQSAVESSTAGVAVASASNADEYPDQLVRYVTPMALT
jgi:hypothetical protein